MKKFIFAALMVVAATDVASAAGGPFSAMPGQQAGPGPFARLFGKQPLPALQAAPWYLYWPYNAHFQTPAPMTGAYYAPPTAATANPYFPSVAPAYPYLPPAAPAVAPAVVHPHLPPAVR